MIIALHTLEMGLYHISYFYMASRSPHSTPHSSSHSSSRKTKREGVTGLIIGDPHLKNRNTTLNKQYVDAILNIAHDRQPTFTVILGDILDTHETIKVSPCKVATEELIDKLSKIAPVFVIIGNHDLSDPNQFLTDNHIFNPLKKWRNVTIIDYPKYIDIKGKEFVMCPYVPPGRFKEALDKVTEDGYAWDIADCIFAHQEFFGCHYGYGPSQKGDKWDEDYPPVISGHIHDEQRIGTNIYYPGASMQHSFSENYKKYVWLVDFTSEPAEGTHFCYEKISLGLNRQRLIAVDVNAMDSFDDSVCDKYRQVKLQVRGTHPEIAAFKKGPIFEALKRKGVLFSYSYSFNKELQTLGEDLARNMETVSLMSYGTLLAKVVGTKDALVKDAYNEILADINGRLDHMLLGVERDASQSEESEEAYEYEDSEEEAEEYDYEESEEEAEYEYEDSEEEAEEYEEEEDSENDYDEDD